ncbi:MAG: mannosyl-3-phosphoglycerate phosphatase [Clostridiales bacterium]|jgi:mannosyl-3-phosphoglycerate phosphatase|nr:mannosyl-3-phosphoglycerate phosphatase [Clostridiales bacterium]
MIFVAFSPANRNIVVFTDLDGTLLDHTTYRFDAALPALRLLKKKNIPLILCSSKTAAEIERLRKQLRLRHPFISENGGGIFVPRGYFDQDFVHDKKTPDYAIIELGAPYSELRAFLNRLQKRFPDTIQGFGDLETEEVARLCGLSVEEARLAKQREHDEPFLLHEARLEAEIVREARAHGIQVTKGGRFYHLIGGNDKGRAVSILTDLFRQERGETTTVGIGDSLNDLAMLAAVDYPVLVKKPDHTYDPSVSLPNLILASSPGPEGFCEAILRLVNTLT